MAVSIPRRAALAALLTAAAAAGLAESPVPAPGRSTLPITVEADSSDFDYRNEALRFTKVRITQGDVRVEADQATASGLNFDNSRWQFEGTVHITVQGGYLSSDTATVEFRANRIARADILGKPAQFEQQRADQLARGHARHIDYDLDSGRVRLEGEAWLSDGHNEINGPSLVYELSAQRVVAQGGKGGDQRVRITINPQDAGGKGATPAPDKAPRKP